MIVYVILEGKLFKMDQNSELPEKQPSNSNLPVTVMELVRELSRTDRNNVAKPQNSQNFQLPCSHKLLRSCSLTTTPHNLIDQNQKHSARSSKSYRASNSSSRHKVPARGTRSLSCSSKDSSALSNQANMAFVPSPGLINSQYSSPYSSIYEDKAEMWNSICRGANPGMDSAVTEDIAVLDDKLEDSTLQNFLTSDVINSLQSSSSLPVAPDFQWGGKPDSAISVSQMSGSLGPNPTLAQLNMDPDMSGVVDDILNMDSEDNLTVTALDFLRSESNSPFSALSCITGDLTSSTKSFITTPANPQGLMSTKIVSASGTTQKSSDLLNSSFIRSSRDNFPPRGSQQPPVGVVTPVKKEKESVDIVQVEKELTKLEDQAPCLQKLLLKEPNKAIKMEPTQCYPVVVAPKESPAQIVPMSSDLKKKSDIVKSEPLSPEKAPAKRGLVKEESTEEKWKDIENFILNPSPEPPMKKRRRNNSGSSAHMSDDEDDDDDRSVYGGKDYDDDSDDDYSDIDADITRILPTECESLVATGKKQKQFFWQYNVQAKGPKGTRLKLAVDESADPHVLNDFEDPVFDESNTMVAGIRHGGKARKGDGNEITPNPKKLFMIGHQLLRLNKQINAFQLGPDVPLAKRNESKKEKNKLASRACRLKKKAQHEANKIKLFGLEQEHSQLNKVLQFIWPHLKDKAKALMGQSDKLASGSELLSQKLERHMTERLDGKIAGHTVDYVNSVILQVEAGDNNGGLKIRKSQKT